MITSNGSRPFQIELFKFSSTVIVKVQFLLDYWKAILMLNGNKWNEFKCVFGEPHLTTYIFINIYWSLSLLNESVLGWYGNSGIILAPFTSSTELAEIQTHDLSIASRVFYPLARTIAPKWISFSWSRSCSITIVQSNSWIWSG